LFATLFVGNCFGECAVDLGSQRVAILDTAASTFEAIVIRKFRSSANGLKALLAVGFLSVAGANASPLCTDTVTMGGNTLDKYIAAGSCIINGTLFGFNLGSYSYTPPVAGNGIGNDVQANAVTVSVLTGSSPARCNS